MNAICVNDIDDRSKARHRERRWIQIRPRMKHTEYAQSARGRCSAVDRTFQMEGGASAPLKLCISWSRVFGFVSFEEDEENGE